MSNTNVYGDLNLHESRDKTIHFNAIAPADTIDIVAPNVFANGTPILNSVPGSTNDVLYNTGGVLDASTDFTWDDATKELNVNGKVTGLSAPTSNGDATNKLYVDGLTGSGVSWKTTARVATTTSGTLASSFENGDTVDGVVLATGDRILIQDQSSGIENGIYNVNASGAPDRSSDMAAASEAGGAAVWVTEGTVNADKGYVCVDDEGSDVVGTDALTFSLFSSVTPTVTLQEVTDNGKTTTNDISITDTTDSSSITTGALKVSGGLGVSLKMSVGGKILFEPAAGSSGFKNTDATIGVDMFDTTTSGDIHIGALQTTGLINLQRSGQNCSVRFKSNKSATSTTNGSVRMDGGLGVVENLHVGGDINYGGFRLPDANHLIDTLATGLFKGGLLSVGAGATFDITAGNGLIVDSHTDPDNPTDVDVTWGAINGTTVTTLGNLFTHVYITTAGAVLQSLIQPTATLRRDDIYLGKVFHSDGATTNAVSNQPDIGIDVGGQQHDFFRGLGPVILTGNRISANGSNLNIDKSAGDFHQAGVGFATLRESPNIINIALDTALTFGLADRNGIISNTALIVPGSYDNAGTVQSIPGSANRATNQRVYLFNSGFVLVQYGQDWYASLAAAQEAIATETFVVEANALANGILIAVISVRSGATDLSVSSDALIFGASKFGEVSIGAAGATTTNLQQAYDNSVTPEMTVDSTRGAVTVIDNASPIGANLFEVQTNAPANIFEVDINGVSITGDLNLPSSVLGETTIDVRANTVSHTLTLPHSQGAANQTIVNDGSGGLRWENNTNSGISLNLGVPTGEAVSSNDDAWKAMAWSDDLGMFVAGSGSVNMIYSADGLTWSEATGEQSGTEISDIIWAGGTIQKFIAVCATGTVRVQYSTDGIAWSTTSVTGLDSNPWRGVTYSPELDLLVAVCNNSGTHRAMTSPDGLAWTPRNTSDDTNGEWFKVTWSPQLHLFCSVSISIVAAADRVMTSPDGITWTGRTASDQTVNVQWFNIAWSPALNLFAAVSEDAVTQRVMTSPDGITWTGRTAASADTWRNIEWSPDLGIFLATEVTGSKMMTSPDGITWSDHNLDADVTGLFAIAWSPALNMFATAGNGNERMVTVKGALTYNGQVLADSVTSAGDVSVGNSILLSDPGAGTDVITIIADDPVTAHTLTLPGTQGGASEVLTNDGSGNLSWAAAGGSLDFGTVTQLTNKSTAVTLNAEVGVITLAAEIIAAHNKKTFTFTNSYIEATSIIIVSTQSEGGEFIWANSRTPTSGSCSLVALNAHTSGSDGSAVSKIHFRIYNA